MKVSLSIFKTKEVRKNTAHNKQGIRKSGSDFNIARQRNYVVIKIYY